MNVFLQRIRASSTLQNVCESRFPVRASGLTASKDLIRPKDFLKLIASLEKSLVTSVQFDRIHSDFVKLRFSNVETPKAVKVALDRLEPVMADAGWWKLEAVFSPSAKTLSLDFIRNKPE